METALPIINNEENNNTEKKKKRGEVIESKFNELIDINKSLATGFMNFSDKFENIMVKPEPKETPKKDPIEEAKKDREKEKKKEEDRENSRKNTKKEKLDKIGKKLSNIGDGISKLPGFANNLFEALLNPLVAGVLIRDILKSGGFKKLLKGTVRSPLFALASGIGIGVMDGVDATLKKDEFNSSKTASFIGGFLSGDGNKGIMSWAKQMGKWALLGAGAGMVAGPVGALTGAFIGMALGGITKMLGADYISDKFDQLGNFFKRQSDLIFGSSFLLNDEDIAKRKQDTQNAIKTQTDKLNGLNEKLLMQQKLLNVAILEGDQNNIDNIRNNITSIKNNIEDQSESLEREREKMNQVLEDEKLKDMSGLERLGHGLKEYTEGLKYIFYDTPKSMFNGVWEWLQNSTKTAKEKILKHSEIDPDDFDKATASIFDNFLGGYGDFLDGTFDETKTHFGNIGKDITNILYDMWEKTTKSIGESITEWKDSIVGTFNDIVEYTKKLFTLDGIKGLIFGEKNKVKKTSIIETTNEEKIINKSKELEKDIGVFEKTKNYFFGKDNKIEPIIASNVEKTSMLAKENIENITNRFNQSFDKNIIDTTRKNIIEKQIFEKIKNTDNRIVIEKGNIQRDVGLTRKTETLTRMTDQKKMKEESVRNNLLNNNVDARSNSSTVVNQQTIVKTANPNDNSFMF